MMTDMIKRLALDISDNAMNFLDSLSPTPMKAVQKASSSQANLAQGWKKTDGGEFAYSNFNSVKAVVGMSVFGEVRNLAGKKFSFVGFMVTIRDGQGTIVNTGTNLIQNFKAGETRTLRFDYIHTDQNQMKDFELEIQSLVD